MAYFLHIAGSLFCSRSCSVVALIVATVSMGDAVLVLLSLVVGFMTTIFVLSSTSGMLDVDGAVFTRVLVVVDSLEAVL